MYSIYRYQYTMATRNQRYQYYALDQILQKARKTPKIYSYKSSEQAPPLLQHGSHPVTVRGELAADLHSLALSEAMRGGVAWATVSFPDYGKRAGQFGDETKLDLSAEKSLRTTQVTVRERELEKHVSEQDWDVGGEEMSSEMDPRSQEHLLESWYVSDNCSVQLMIMCKYSFSLERSIFIDAQSLF